MGLLDGLLKAGLGKVLGGSQQSSGGIQSQVVDALLKQVMGGGSSQQSGSGLNGLLDMMKGNGLEDIVSSWVGQGENQQISAEQVEQGLDSNLLENIAGQLGTSKSQAASELGNILPGLIDKLTPQGQADNELGLDDAVNLLSKFMK